MNSDVISGMQNRSVYTKSTQDEAHFPLICSLTIPCSTAYSTRGLIPWGIDRDSLRHPSQVDMNINISTATRGKLHAPHTVPSWELIPCLWLKIWANFPPQLKWSFPSDIGMWDGPCVFFLKWNGLRETQTQKKPGFPCSGLNSGSCCISQVEGVSEYLVETLENAVVLRLICIGVIISLGYIESRTEFKASKGDDAWLFLKIDRNPNITVPTRKWAWVSCLTSRSVHIFLPSLV